MSGDVSWGLWRTDYRRKVLNFWDILHHEEYWDNLISKGLLNVDCFVHANGVVHGVMMFVAMGRDAPPWVYKIIGVWLALTFWQVYASFCRLPIYVRRRTWILSVGRVLFVLFASLTIPYGEPPEANTLAVISKLIFNSNIATLWILALGLPINFTTHALVQPIACAVAMCFASSFCARWFGAEAFPALFNRFGAVMDRTLYKGMTLSGYLQPTAGSETCSCVLFVRFLQGVFGLLVPSAINYLLEFLMRVWHISASRQRYRHSCEKALSVSWSDALIVTVWFLFLGSIFWWVLLRAFVGAWL